MPLKVRHRSGVGDTSGHETGGRMQGDSGTLALLRLMQFHEVWGSSWTGETYTPYNNVVTIRMDLDMRGYGLIHEVSFHSPTSGAQSHISIYPNCTVFEVAESLIYLS